MHKPIHPAGLVKAALRNDGEPAWCWVEWACFCCSRTDGKGCHVMTAPASGTYPGLILCSNHDDCKEVILGAS